MFVVCFLCLKYYFACFLPNSSWFFFFNSSSSSRPHTNTFFFSAPYSVKNNVWDLKHLILLILILTCYMTFSKSLTSSKRRKLTSNTSVYIWVQSQVRPLSRAPGVSRTMGVFLEIMSTQCKEPVSGSVRHIVKPWNLCADGKRLLQLAVSP